MSGAVQRLCAQLAARLRLNSHSQAALQTAARHLATGAGDRSDSSSSDDEHDQQTQQSVYDAVGQDHETDDSEVEEPDFDPEATVDGGRAAYEFPGGAAEGAFMMSDALTALWEDVQRTDRDAMLDQIEKDLAESETAPKNEVEAEEAGPDDYRLLLEAIKLYFAAAPVEDEELDGMNTEDREIMAAIAGVLQDELEGPMESVVNIAPPGRLPWEIIEVDEEAGAVHWGVDFTEGRAEDPWRNALLSNEAKQLMYNLHKENPEEYSVERLASEFKVRQQRVMAILALKQMEADARAKGEFLDEEFQEIMDSEVYGADEATGSGERHYTILPSYPNYKELEPSEVVSRLEAKLRKPIAEITPEDLTPELAREVLGVQNKEDLEEELAAKEEHSLVTDFKRNLEYNMGKTGEGIKRASRAVSAPRRPRKGWSLVVTPLGKTVDPRQQAREAFVALPDGSRRPLTEDERLFLERGAALPRRKVL